MSQTAGKLQHQDGSRGIGEAHHRSALGGVLASSLLAQLLRTCDVIAGLVIARRVRGESGMGEAGWPLTLII
jgi:hypothetical protein